MSGRKRKHHKPYNQLEKQDQSHPPPHELDLSLFIQAHEAEIIRGPRALAAARSLATDPEPGDALIRWGGASGPPAQPLRESASRIHDSEDEMGFNHVHEGREVWVDRYDARLLLSSLLERSAASPVPPSPAGSGWSDLPSDAEDTFFFSLEEAEDYRRDKRRRVMDRERDARVRARLAEDGENEPAPEDTWGGSDEEPDEAQRSLMFRTAAHLESSPNRAQLEMRILANHGADARFAFLRGRWSRVWASVLEKKKLEREEEYRRGREEALGGLAGYGSDEDESDGEGKKRGGDDGKGAEVEDDEASASVIPMDEGTATERDHEAVKEARRARLREWAEKRRIQKQSK